MISDQLIIDIVEAHYLKDCQLEIIFSDGNKRIIDFSGFLSRSNNPGIRKYLHPNNFRQYVTSNDDLYWNDYDLCFSSIDLHEDNFLKSK